MPRPTHRICGTPGCPNPTPCEDHPPRQAWEGSDRAKRLPPTWGAIRLRVLRRDRYTCQACRGMTCGNVDLEVDHITRGDDHSLTNLQTLGATCHRAKTQAEAAAARTH